MRILLGSRVAFRFAHHAVAIDIKAVVVGVEGLVACVEGIKRRTIVTYGDGVKTTGSVTHVGLVTVGHAVAIGIRQPRVEVDTVVVLIQIARQSAREAGFGAICRIGPTEFLGGVQAIVVSVGVGIRSIVLVHALYGHTTTIGSRPIHPFLKQRFVNVRNQIPVGIRVWRRRLCRVIGVDIGDVGDGWKLRHKQQTDHDGEGGQESGLTTTHDLTNGKAYASPNKYSSKIAYEGDGTLFIHNGFPIARKGRISNDFVHLSSVCSRISRDGCRMFA